MVEESLICFGEVFCMFWVFDIIMIGVFDDIEFVDEVIIKIIWKIENLFFYFFLIKIIYVLFSYIFYKFDLDFLIYKVWF